MPADGEAEAPLEAHRPEDPRRILDERQGVENPDGLSPMSRWAPKKSITSPNPSGESRTARVLMTRSAAVHVLLEGAVLHRGERRRLEVIFDPRGGDVDLEPVPEDHHGGAELVVRPDAGPLLLRERLGEPDAVPLDHDVHVEVVDPHHEVPDEPADRERLHPETFRALPRRPQQGEHGAPGPAGPASGSTRSCGAPSPLPRGCPPRRRAAPRPGCRRGREAAPSG